MGLTENVAATSTNSANKLLTADFGTRPGQRGVRSRCTMTAAFKQTLAHHAR
jgi:hypothetical protein